MCQQQQQQTAKVAPTTTTTTTEEEHVGFVSCGLDRSCPKSVTTPQGQGVRLDQYQSSITGNTTDRRRRRQRRQQSCTGATSIATATSLSTSIDTDTDTAATSTCASVISDHDFEWYDLDAIREAHNSNSNSNDRAIIIGHDFHAGLVFTTERQVLGKGAEVNIANSFTRSGFNGEKIGSNNNRSTQKKDGQEFEFDLFFWINNNSDHNNRVGETPLEKDEREFRERMEELEQEINNCYNDNNDSSSSSSSSSLSSSSSSNFNGNENGRDDDSNFFASLQFGDPIIQ